MKTLSALLFVVFLAGAMCMSIGLNGHHATGGPVSGTPASGYSTSGLAQCCTVSGDNPVLHAGFASRPLNAAALALVFYIFFVSATPLFSFYHPPRA